MKLGTLASRLQPKLLIATRKIEVLGSWGQYQVYHYPNYCPIHGGMRLWEAGNSIKYTTNQSIERNTENEVFENKGQNPMR